MAKIQNLTEKNLLSVSETAKMLGVSIDTLRRWDKSGKLKAIRRTKGGNRYYQREELELFLEDIFALARVWAQSDLSPELPTRYYCEAHPRFQARLEKMGIFMMQHEGLEALTPLLVAVTGEVGNNSFDHNIGNWPDVLGAFFAYDVGKRLIVLADRGRGIRTTLKRVRPGIETDLEALTIAFTEFISARAPERRGNGLKFVREIAENQPIGVELQSGIAVAQISKKSTRLEINIAQTNIRGTLTKITF